MQLAEQTARKSCTVTRASAVPDARDENGDVIKAAYRDPSFGWGCGALYSTAVDLLDFARALVDGRLLSAESRELMWTSRTDTPWGDRYGFGWFLGDLDGHASVMALGAKGKTRGCASG